jgi:[ribosomal protein S5]-alanine N-acetyltransferase
MTAMINLMTARTLIRNFSVADWSDLGDIVVDKAISPYAVYDYPVPTDEPTVKDMAAWFASGDSFLAVHETSANKIIGYISLNGDAGTECDFGYCLHSAYQGKGYAFEACTAVVNYAFGVLKINRLTAGTAVLNLPSCQLLAKLGFQKTSEFTTSFHKSAAGEPIEFTGASFELSRDNWIKTDYAGLG